MKKRLVIAGILLSLCVVFIAARETQVWVPFFTVSGELKAGNLNAEGLEVTTTGQTLGTLSSSSTSYGRLIVQNTGNVGDNTITFKSNGTEYWTIGNDNNETNDFRIAYAGSFAGNVNQYFHIENDGHVIAGSDMEGDSVFSVNGGADVGGGLLVDYSLFAGDSAVGGELVKAGDNSTYSKCAPGDANWTTSSSKELKNILKQLQVNEDDFLAVNVYEWNYKKSKVNDPKLANKLHWSTTAEEFAGIHGNGKEIDQGKAFWYLWGMVQQEIRNRQLLERYVDHLHQRIEDLERF